jgi:CheY-like chemotaxis protein
MHQPVNPLPILYVEDEETDVMLLRHVFAKMGIPNPLYDAKDGQVAIDYLAGNGVFADRLQHPLPGLVLLDLNLPCFSGVEVLAWLRCQPHLRRLPVVILSSSIRSSDIERAYDAGANGYLVKPNSLEELSALVKALRDFWFLHNQPPESLGAAPPDLKAT